MICESKNNLLDLYFLEGDEHKLSKIRAHAENCNNCRYYLGSLKETLDMLDVLEVEEPSEKVFDKIIQEISDSSARQLRQKDRGILIPILEIVLGQILIFITIYFMKIYINSMPVWKTIRENWIMQSLGSTGAAVILILIVGIFIALSLAPILIFESKKYRYDI
jgi:predicted anti-sigma-YlaC factor YlaD